MLLGGEFDFWKNAPLPVAKDSISCDLRVAGLNSGSKRWKLASATVSARDRAAGVTVTPQAAVGGEDGWLRVLLKSPRDRSVRWTLTFATD